MASTQLGRSRAGVRLSNTLLYHFPLREKTCLQAESFMANYLVNVLFVTSRLQGMLLDTFSYSAAYGTLLRKRLNYYYITWVRLIPHAPPISHFPVDIIHSIYIDEYTILCSWTMLSRVAVLQLSTYVWAASVLSAFGLV